VIGANATVNTNARLTVGSLKILGTGKLYIDDTLQVSTLDIQSGGLLSHHNIVMNNPAIPGVRILADTILVRSGGSIDVNGKGYPHGYGPNGMSSPYNYVSGSHGGLGASAAITIYGDFRTPVYAGSGGSSTVTGTNGSGGGIVYIKTQLLVLDGAIKADGIYGAYGSGAGGSIWVIADSLSGIGTLSTMGGGTLSKKEAGGGRVALCVRGVANGCIDRVSTAGYDMGTLYIDRGVDRELRINDPVKPLSPFSSRHDFWINDSTLTIIVGNGARATLYGETHLKALYARKDGEYVLAGRLHCPTISVDSAANVTHPALACPTVEVPSVYINAQSISIAKGGSINVTGKGYPKAKTNGCLVGSTNDYVGGSHGGRGSGASAPIYGDLHAPCTPGGGGGGNSGASGGGVIFCKAHLINVMGDILANGNKDLNYGCGAGGSIYFVADSIIGTGRIRANGEYNLNSRGGGGRISLQSCAIAQGISDSLSVTGSEAGSIYTNCPLPEEHIVKIISPADSSYTNKSPARITWNVDNILQTSDTLQSLVEGRNAIVRSFTGLDGVTVADTIVVFYSIAVPVVQIVKPSSDTLINQTDIWIVWKADGVYKQDQSSVRLIEGPNSIIRKFTNIYGTTGADTVIVTCDLTYPVVTITYPKNKQVFLQDTIPVEWYIDGVRQTTQTDQILINGDNRIFRESTDPAGNRTVAWVDVHGGALVPDVRALQYANALETLDAQAIRSDTVHITDFKHPSGWVVDQQPAPGDTLLDGASLKLFVAENTSFVDLVALGIDASQLHIDSTTLAFQGTVSIDYANIGNCAVQSPFTILVFEDINANGTFEDSVDNAVSRTRVTDPIGANDTATTSAACSSAVQFIGSIIYAKIDIENEIVESNEKNNITNNRAQCTIDRPVGVFNPVVEWHWMLGPDSSDQIYHAPVVANLNDDNHDGKIDSLDIPDIIFSTFKTDPYENCKLRALSGDGSGQLFAISNPATLSVPNPAVADIDSDGLNEIITFKAPYAQQIIAFENNGTLKWISDTIPTPSLDFWPNRNIAVADIDRDGNPEIITSHVVLNSNGSIRWKTSKSNLLGERASNFVCVADLDMVGDMEIVCGNTAYRSDGSIYWRNDAIRPSFTPTAIGNFDDDAYPEIIAVNEGRVMCLEHDGRIKWGPVYGNWGQGAGILGYYDLGGSPTIADFDNDNRPEIGVAGATHYVVFETDGKEKWRKKINDASSLCTGSSVFDFEGDGSAEAVYADQDSLRIYRGSDGQTLFKMAIGSGTYTELPVITDVDNDGNAEIVIISNTLNNFNHNRGIYVIGDANDTWVNTRKIWNQHDYHITNISENGTVPRFENPSWLAYNSYRQNLMPNANGCTDITASMPRVEGTQNPDSALLKVRVGNASLHAIPAGLSVAVYKGPGSEKVFEKTTLTTKRLRPGEFEDVGFTLPSSQAPAIGYTVVADDDGYGNGKHFESDEQNNELFISFDLTNLAPQFVSQPVLTGAEGAQYTYDAEAVDANSDPLVYVLTQRPFGMIIDSTTGAITWTPTASQGGKHAVRLIVTDRKGGYAEQKFSIIVTDNENGAPVILSVPLLNATVDQQYLYQIQANDPDHDAIEYMLDHAPTGMTINQSTGLVSWTPQASQLDTHTVTIRVSDSRGGNAIQQYVLRVSDEANAMPAFQSTAIASAEATILYTYTALATDPDNDQLVYTLAKSPAGMRIDRSSGAIQWTPLVSQVGLHHVQILASDMRGATAMQEYDLTVAQFVNNAPAIVSIPATQAQEGVAYSYDVNATDADADRITYRLLQFVTSMTIDSTTGLVSWVPPFGAAGTYPIAIEVRDAHGATAVQNFSLVVNPGINTAPRFVSMPVITATVGEPYSYQVQVIDDQSDAVTIVLGQHPECMIMDASALITWVPKRIQLGQQTVVITAIDEHGLSNQQTFEITVAPGPNHAPQFTSQPVTSVNEYTGYLYKPTVTDSDNDSLFFWIKQGPSGMTLDSVTSEIRLFAGSELVGSHPVSIALTDRIDTVYQQFTLTVINVNTPPQIVSQPAPWAAIGREYRYQIIATDNDNDPLVYTLITQPSGASIDTATGLLTWTPGISQLGTHAISVKVRDTVGAFVEQSWSISVFDLANKPPRIISQPVPIAWIGATYVYQIQAIDPESRQLTYRLINAPQGMTVSASGNIAWPDHGMRTDGSSVTVEVADDSAATADQTWTIRLAADTVPPVAVIQFSQNPVKTGKTVMISALATDNVAVASTAQSIDNVAVELNAANQYVLQTTRNDTLDICAIAIDVNGLADTVHAALFVNDAIDDEAPVVTLSCTPLNPAVGDIVTCTVTADDDFGIDAERVWLAVDGQYLPLHNGTAEYRAMRQGTVTALATAYDISGNFGKAQQTFTITNAMPELIPPAAQITSPAADSVIYGQTQVLGTADDDQFAYYKLAYIANGDTIEISRHDTPVHDGELGLFDGTSLQNGDYVILLTVYDRSGNTTFAQTNVRVTGNQKLGQFTLSFEDLSIPLPGFNLAVNRTYDSRDKSKGDFGYGWNMDLKTIRLSENRNQGIHWALADSGFDVITPIKAGFFDTVHIPRYYLRAIKPHTVTISIPGVRDQVFDANPQLFYQYDPNYGFMNYTPRQGTYSRMKQLDAGYFYRAMDDNLYRLDNMEPEPYDPDLYELTLVDGTRYIIDQKAGNAVTTIDRNGNRVSLKRDSISHSIGLKFAFIRDSENRITSISDGTGRVIRYTYDGHGNLLSVTDPNDNITRFKYAPDHYLTEIFDARGVRAVRTEYDNDEGRMVRHISQAGDTITFEHDLDNAIARTTDFNGNETQFTYDERGNVLSKTDAGGNTWQYTYDDEDNLLSTTNPDGATSSSTWDNKGNELSSTDENGHTTSRMYNDRGQTLTKTDALNRTTQYEYDPNGNELREIGPDGVITSEKNYAMWGVVAIEKDALGNLTSYGYDNLGRINSRTDPLGRVTRYILDTRGRTLADIGPTNDTTRYFYDNTGNQIMTVNAMGDTARSTYTPFNKILTQTDAKGNTTTFEYDLFGQLMRTIALDGSFTSNTYDAQGNPLTATDQVGRVTTSVYDYANRQIKTIFNDGAYTESEYNAVGRRVMTIDANGNRTEYEYDPVGNNTVVRDALGNETHYEYDDVNRREAVIDALGRRTTFAYDDYDRLTRTTFADGTYKTTEYDEAGRKMAEVDQANKRTEFEYDPVGNLIKVTDAMGHETRYGYDSKNNRINQTDANNHTTHLEYDRLGRMIRRTYPGGDDERFGYNSNGSMVYTVKGLDSLSYQYDSRNREILRTYHNSGHTVKTCYTADGRPDTVTDYRGATVYVYDDHGRQSKVTNPDGTFIESRYDANGNRMEVETPWSKSGYSYDKLNRMKIITNPENAVTTYFYNAVGNRDSVANANGTSTSYSFDNLNRLTNVTNYGPDGVLSSYAYQLNPTGIREVVTETDGSQVYYGYDDLYRLTSETRMNGNTYSITYTYDNVGNRLTQNKNGQVTTYAYNNRDQLTTETGSEGVTSYAYDAAGHLVCKEEQIGTNTYTWEDNDRMASVTNLDGSTSYIYDYEGSCIKTNDGSGAKWYLIDKQLSYGQVIAEYEDGGSLTVEYVYGLERVSQRSGGSVHYYLVDGQGSVRQLTDANGGVTDTWTYTAFGEELVRTGPTPNEFRYVGEQWDPNTGLYNNRARWMDPSIGRFVSSDQYFGDVQSLSNLHRYLYVGNSPVSSIDPSGYWGISEAIITSEQSATNINLRPIVGNSCNCGKDVTSALKDTYNDVSTRYASMTEEKQRVNREPFKLANLLTNEEYRTKAAGGWEIWELTWGWDDSHLTGTCGKGPGSRETVTIGGKCYYSWDVNYILFGWLNKLSGLSKENMLSVISMWSVVKPFRNHDITKYENPTNKKLWAIQGYNGSFDPPSYIDSKYSKCKACKNESYSGVLNSNWPHSEW
jgi:RHS repeat-associated protein